MKENNHKILRNYVSPSGKVPFLEWLNGLKDSATRLRIRHRLDRLELGNLGDCQPVGEGVLELRLFFGAGYRIYTCVLRWKSIMKMATQRHCLLH